MTEEINNSRSDKNKLEEQMKSLPAQNNTLSENVSQPRETINNLPGQVSDISTNMQQAQEAKERSTEENPVLTKATADKKRPEIYTFFEEVSQPLVIINYLPGQVSDISTNMQQAQEAKECSTEENQFSTRVPTVKNPKLRQLLSDLGKIDLLTLVSGEARKINAQIQKEEDLMKTETLKQQAPQSKSKESEPSTSSGKQKSAEANSSSWMQCLIKKQVNQEIAHRKTIENLNRTISSGQEQTDALKKQIDALKGEMEAFKRTKAEREEKIQKLFAVARNQIKILSEQNKELQMLNKKSESNKSDLAGTSTQSDNTDLLDKIEKLQRENQEIIEKRMQEKEKSTTEIDNLTQRVLQLQRQLESHKESKPSTSSGPSEKSTSEPPTSNIKPMAGHSTNAQTQSVSIQLWHSGGEPPLASIQTQLETVAVLPTSQNPSGTTVVLPPQQQIYTSPHTDYVCSASTVMLGPRQLAIPPTQETDDDENSIQIQNALQQEAMDLVLPRVEPPSSGVGSTQEQDTSNTSNTFSTTQAGLNRQRDFDSDTCQVDQDKQQQNAPQQQAVASVLPRVETPSSGVRQTQEQGTSNTSNTVTTTQAALNRQRNLDSKTCQVDQDKQQQNAPQQQAVVLVLPRVEPPSSGVGQTQEQGTSISSNTVTTTQAELKRKRGSNSDTCQVDQDKQQQTKRTRVRVSSKEEPVSMDEGGEKEGREAEASPSAATGRNLRHVEARRCLRVMIPFLKVHNLSKVHSDSNNFERSDRTAATIARRQMQRSPQQRDRCLRCLRGSTRRSR